MILVQWIMILKKIFLLFTVYLNSVTDGTWVTDRTSSYCTEKPTFLNDKNGKKCIPFRCTVYRFFSYKMGFDNYFGSIFIFIRLV